MEKLICDGCNVRNSWGHKCHGYNSMINGECTDKTCACKSCRELDLEFPKSATVKEKDNPLKSLLNKK